MIINIRGTSGSGKSTVIRELFARASSSSHWQPDWSQINPDPRPTDESGKVKSRKRPWGYLLQMPTGKQVVVLGHYETACGGCDTLPSFDLGFALIRHADSLGFDVVYEGLLYSAETERTLALHREGRDLHVLGLNTPLDVCLASVNARRQRSNRAQKRAAAGKDPLPDVNPKNTESKFKGTQSTMKKLQEAGVDARWCTREECVAHLLHLLGGPLSDAEASLIGHTPSPGDPPMTREQDSAFQRVTKEINGGCPCACHTGIGSAASCVHCSSPPAQEGDANPLCAAAMERVRKESDA